MSKKNLLIMDDDQDFGEYIKAIAEANDYNVFYLADSSSFIEHLHNHKPDLIILDLEIPNVDGVQLLRLLKDENCSCPIAITSALDDKIVLSAQRLGLLHGLDMLPTLQKPIQVQDLDSLLKKIGKTCEVTPKQLSRAIAEKKLIVYYQPKVSLQNGQLVGAEALVRWQKEDGSFIMPDSFIPLAEECGLIKKLTLLVLEKSLQECASYYSKKENFLTSVNLSAKLLTDLQLPNELEEFTKQYQVDPANICLEITETAAMSQPLQAIDILTRFRMKKFIVSVDDFGTGFSSLALLHRIPFNELKIDKKFIKNIAEQKDLITTVQEMITLGKNYGYKITAEGVETKEDLLTLRNLRCDIGQGYYLGRPMPIQQFKTWEENILNHEWRTTLL